MCGPKRGGLGVIDLRIFNMALMIKCVGTSLLTLTGPFGEPGEAPWIAG